MCHLNNCFKYPLYHKSNLISNTSQICCLVLVMSHEILLRPKPICVPFKCESDLKKWFHLQNKWGWKFQSQFFAVNLQGFSEMKTRVCSKNDFGILFILRSVIHIKVTILSSQMCKLCFCLVKKGRFLFSLFCFILLASANLRNYNEKTWEKLSLYFKSNKILQYCWTFSTLMLTKVQFTIVCCKF